jgi:signal peptidase I
MAETLLGQHDALDCPDCQFPIRCDAADPSPHDPVVCPNCGFAIRSSQPIARRRGERVILDRIVPGLALPKRWDVVAFCTPGDAQRLSIKRVVGLPGERVSIHRGDLYVDGQICKKSLRQLRTMAVLVHDSAYRPNGDSLVPRRWRPESDDSRWTQRGPQIFHSPHGPENGKADWLNYHHWGCMARPLPRTEPCPVLDNYGFNQHVSRKLHRVSDLLLTCHVLLEDVEGSLLLRFHDGDDCFVCELAPGRQHCELTHNGRIVASASCPAVDFARGAVIEFGVFDHRAAFAVDRRTVFEYDYHPIDGGSLRFQAPFSIGSRQLAVEITRLQLLRDLYYLDAHGLGRDWQSPATSRKDTLFVLGDNVPVSQDSRHWNQAGLAVDAIEGRVKFP